MYEKCCALALLLDKRRVQPTLVGELLFFRADEVYRLLCAGVHDTAAANRKGDDALRQ